MEGERPKDRMYAASWVAHGCLAPGSDPKGATLEDGRTGGMEKNSMHWSSSSE